MTQVYFNPKRAAEAHALPDCEVFYVSERDTEQEPGTWQEPGWYWWACFPGCMPDGEPIGPFATEAGAVADAQSGDHDE